MRQNALLRSRKGSDAPATARKNAAHVAVVKAAPAEDRDDHFAIRDGVRCAGVHLIIDLHGAEGLNDIDLIETTLRRCAASTQRRRVASIKSMSLRPSAPCRSMMRCTPAQRTPSRMAK